MNISTKYDVLKKSITDMIPKLSEIYADGHRNKLHRSEIEANVKKFMIAWEKDNSFVYDTGEI